MKCTECLRLLDDYRDGELDEKKASAVESHIAECRACAAELDVLKSEAELFERYRVSQQNEIADPAEKWDALREKIASRDESARVPQQAGQAGLGWMGLFFGSRLVRQAAFAAVVVVLSVSATLFVVNLNRTKAPADSVSSGLPDASIPAAFDASNTGLESAMNAVRRAEREYIQAIQILSEIVDRRMPSLDPVLAAKFRTNLKAIDENIAETRKAYYQKPSDPELAQFMLAAYSKKVELLQQMVT
jgi:hypothetical protein